MTRTAIAGKTRADFDLHLHLRKYGTIYAFAALVVLNMLLNRNFASMGTLWNLTIQVLPTMLTSLGMVLVISSGGIDISVGSVMAISAVMSGMVLTGKFPAVGTGVGTAVVLALAAALVLGLFNGALVAFFQIQPIIVTLILFIAGRGVAQLMNAGGTIVFYNNSFTDIGLYRVGGVVPVQLFVSLFFVLLIAFLLKKTTFGYYVQGIGENPKASRLSGVRTTGVLLSIYVVSALLAGLAGVFECSRASCADPNSIGVLAELDAIAAVAIGGTSMSGGKARVIGTIFGALIIQLVSIMVNMNNIPFAYSRIFKAAIIIVAVYLQREKRS
ncbi:MAG: ABC transporter permease [Eubacteriales bacterium]|nr:ABC transporter permease [Eubacteriales bacterium]